MKKKKTLREMGLPLNVKLLLAKSNVKPEEYLNMTRYYQKQGQMVPPEEVVKSIQKMRVEPAMAGIRNMVNTSPRKQSNIVPPMFSPSVSSTQVANDNASQSSIEQKRQRLFRPKMAQNEGKKVMKKFVVTEAQLQDLVKKAVVTHNRNAKIKRLVAEHLNEQVMVQKQINKILVESPLKNVWQGIKDKASQVVAGGRQQLAQGHQAFSGEAAREHQNQATQAAQKALNASLQSVAKFKQKYNAEILKNAEILNGYHDAVLNLWKTLEGSPFLKQVHTAQPKSSEHLVAKQMVDNVKNTVRQFYYDLRSEGEQITQFMKSLKRDMPSPLINQDNAPPQHVQDQRNAEAEEYAGRSMTGRSSSRAVNAATRYPKTEAKKPKKKGSK